jgi:hypothetical protein
MNPTPPSKLFWLFLLLAFWSFYGLIGRDAWKAEEAVALTPILDWLDGLASIWSTPAPLYTLAAGFAVKMGLAGGDIQDAARLTSGLFTCIALLFTGLSARALYGPGFGSTAAIALVGGFGLMLRAHALLPETALLAAWSVLLYGVIAARNHPVSGMLAIGMALPLLTLGLRGLPDLIAGLLIVLLPLFSPTWSDRHCRKTVLRGLLLGVGVMLIGLVYLLASGDWNGWLQWHGPAQFAALRTPSSAFAELPWFVWPLWPLAFAAIWHEHRRLTRAVELHIPLLAVVVLLAAALVPAWSRDGALMPVFMPLALLAAYGVDNLRRGAAQAFYWFGVLLFTLLAFVFWVYFAAIEWGYPSGLAHHLARLTPSYRPGSVQAASYVLAGAATLLWLIATPLFPRAKNRPILVWATGMILIWILVAALFRPWIEAGWAYRPLIADLSRHLPAGACLNVAQVDPAMQTMLRLHRRAAVQASCPWTLKLAAKETGKSRSTPEHRVLWQGARPRYKSQVYRLEWREPKQP